MKYITLNFRCGGKVKLPTNIFKSIDVPDDFTVNKEGENTNKRICIAEGCYVDSLDKTKSLENQLPGKKCYISDDFSNNQLVNDDEYEFLEEILNSYRHDDPILYFSTVNGIIGEEFGLRPDEVTFIPIGYVTELEEPEEIDEEEEEPEEIIAYVNANTEELDIEIEVYKDKNGNTPAPNGRYNLYANIGIEVPDDVYGFTVEDGIISELLAATEEDEGVEEG